jgi:hypothetical protein
MRKIALMWALVGLLAAGVAQASVSVQALAYQLEGNGGAKIPSASLTVAIVDKDRDGIGAVMGADPNTFVWDSDDWRIFGSPNGGAGALWAEPTSNDVTTDDYNYLDSRTYQFNLDASTGDDYVDKDDPVFLVYFPGLGVGATKPGPNQWFGVVELGPLPGDGGTLQYYKDNLTVTAQYQTAPEPATMALMLAGGGLMMALRRRRSR